MLIHKIHVLEWYIETNFEVYDPSDLSRSEKGQRNSGSEGS